MADSKVPIIIKPLMKCPPADKMIKSDQHANPIPTFARWARRLLVIYWPILAIATHWPELQLLVIEDNKGVPLDKLAHLGCFSVLTLLVFHAALFGRSIPLLYNGIASIAIVSVYGVVDELTQPLSFGRTWDAFDLITDISAAVGTSLFLVVRYRSSSTASTKPANEIQGHSFVGHAATVSLLTLVSRITGLLRESLLGATFGLSGTSDAFMIGFVVPNLFRRLFGEGALSAAFIPAYTELQKANRDMARRFASACVALMLIGLGGITIISELILWSVLSIGTWTDTSSLAIRLTMTMLPYMPLVCLVALLGGVLQVHGRFGPPAAAPILLNIVMIGAIVLSAWGYGSLPNRGIFVVAVSVLFAGLLQLGWQILSLIGHERLTQTFAGTGPALRSMLVTMLPMVIGLAVFQINALLDMMIAFGFSPKEDGPATLNLFGWQTEYPIDEAGAMTALVFAQRLYQFPLGVFGIAIATAIFPALAHAAATNSLADGSPTADMAPFRSILQRGLRLTVFIAVPASVGLMIVGLPLARFIFEYQKIDPKDAQRIATILIGYASGIWAYSTTHVLTRAFYAIKDTRTPLRVSLRMVGLNLLLNLALIWPLGAAGLAWSTAICAACQVALLIHAAGRQLPNLIDANVWRSWTKSVLVTAVMACTLIPLTMIFDPADLSHMAAAGLLAALVVAGMAIIVVGGLLLKAEEPLWLLRRSQNTE